MADPVVPIKIVFDLPSKGEIEKQINARVEGINPTVKMRTDAGGAVGARGDGTGPVSTLRNPNAVHLTRSDPTASRFRVGYTRAELEGGLPGAQQYIDRRLASTEQKLERLKRDYIANRTDRLRDRISRTAGFRNYLEAESNVLQRRIGNQAQSAGVEEIRRQERAAAAAQTTMAAELGRANQASRKDHQLNQRQRDQQATWERQRGIAERRLESMPAAARNRIQELTLGRMGQGVEYLQALKEATTAYKQEAAATAKRAKDGSLIQRRLGDPGKFSWRRTDLGSTGEMMSFMFGGWEVGKAITAFAQFNNPFLNRGALNTMANQSQAIQGMGGGIFGGIVRGSFDLADAASLLAGASTVNAQKGFGLMGKSSPLALSKAQADAEAGIRGIGVMSNALASIRKGEISISEMERGSRVAKIPGGFARRRQEIRDTEEAGNIADNETLEQLRLNLADARTLGDPSAVFAAKSLLSAFQRTQQRRTTARQGLSSAETAALAREQDHQNAMIGLDLGTRNSVVDRLMNRNQIGAQSSQMVGGIMQQFFGFVGARTMAELREDTKDYDVARRMLDTGTRELEMFKTEYMRSFRGEQFDVRNIAVSKNDLESPQEVLQSIHSDMGKLLQAVTDLGSN